MSDPIDPKQPDDEAADLRPNESHDHPPKEPQPVPDDPFHPSSLAKHRLSQDFESMAPVKPVIATIKPRKPHRQEFIRVRPGTEFYMVVPGLWHVIPSEIRPVALVLTISRNSPVPFLWPLNLPSADGRTNSWNESAIDVEQAATKGWVSCRSDQNASMYIGHAATADHPEPEWPEDLTMHDYLKLAFKDRLIDDVNHPCLQKLRGEI
jgi:hypothetical protein